MNLATEDPAQVEETENNWVHITKIVIVCGKVIFISTMLTLAILAYRKKD
eukprot:CAMPEP_0176376804 /NCGR_PEP_ID=MMETSP0126-20121128/28441_1 /TAXON_ID=141414 ORGANISM="Strombidinopsis acuminatum, Strain SPMC142" /NCGR_SAMPLE_ID=MMETSP0126 /ASSEMBLY_ACC=CAM_ASM_000229 /LENGTH=49 /DNA_ID=CAMNT_0017738381 /DNA_START=48 /DNA_END=197 /DNA_ORIENTATION=+